MKAISWARTLPLRVQLAVIGFGYAAVLAYAVTAKYMRHLAELKDSISASGGMWAFGDELLAWSIFFCFMVPTFFLVRSCGSTNTLPASTPGSCSGSA